jgi:hypothetical protein
MSSPDSSEPLDLEQGLPVNAEDVSAQRRARELLPKMTMAEYLSFLTSLPAATYEQLKARPRPQGEPFKLPE